MSTKFYFNLWKINIEKIKAEKEYDQWCEIHDSDLKKQQFAAESGIDPKLWCRNCIHFECYIHSEYCKKG